MGLPVEFHLTPGQEADVTHAETLLKDHAPEKVIADKGYDSDALVKKIESQGAEAVIPPKKNRIHPRTYDRHTYKERNHVERFWNKMKQFRRIATRYEKTKRNFLAFVHVGAIMLLLQ